MIFCGSGATGAIDRLVRILRLRVPAGPPATGRPGVLIGPYEHHSNELMWRETDAELIRVAEDRAGGVDIADLEAKAGRLAGRPLVIGSFSAASNVTGIITDVDRVATTLHRFGALACFDYAAGGPYLPIEMNPGSPAAYKDAIFLSPHKFPGGPGTPGVLVVKRALVDGTVPTVPGGGTVTFVSPTVQRYHRDAETREEGGTPAIVESIRAGLVFALKDAVGAAAIRAREEAFARRALAAWGADPRIRVLGAANADRLAIVSFGIRHPRGLLHSHLVVALLSDLFGIQARSGCFCAAPYVHREFPIDDAASAWMERQALDGYPGAKLSLTRIGFPYFLSEAVFGYVVAAVRFLAAHAASLLPLYRFDPTTGCWRHRIRPPASFGDLGSFVPGIGGPPPAVVAPESVLPGYLDRAAELIGELRRQPPPPPVDDPLPAEFDRLRWFPLPAESGCG